MAGFDATRASKWAHVSLTRGLRQNLQALLIAALALVTTLFLATAVSPPKARYARVQVGFEPIDLDTEDPPTRLCFR